ncbi:MAG: hypothetical protein N2V78_00195 [Methanophagales archaeon]|nr:hypothetical protein [Methanophagales archaeon]
MNLKALVSQHQQGFKQKVMQTLSAKHSMSMEQVVEEHGDVITRYVQEKYKGIEQAVSKILEFKRPVVLSIRRDPCSDDVCMICERDQPNIKELQRLYGDRVVFYEIYDSSSEGALYHVIHQGEGEKLLPLTAIIHKGEVKRYWSGRPVEVEEYRQYLDPLLV